MQPQTNSYLLLDETKGVLQSVKHLDLISYNCMFYSSWNSKLVWWMRCNGYGARLVTGSSQHRSLKVERSLDHRCTGCLIKCLNSRKAG